MNIRIDPDDIAGERDGTESEAVAATRRPRLGFWRLPLRQLTLSRVLWGGRLGDLGRLPRYLTVIALGAAGLWAPIIAYITLAPVSYTSELSLILPGAGAESSVNLSDIGQASSSASSPYSSSAVSPTATYKSILTSRTVADRAAERLGVAVEALGQPRVKLLDQTSLITVSMSAPTPEEAHARLSAILDALLAELETLRADEIARRETATQTTIGQYKSAVDEIEAKISALRRSSGLISQQQYKDIVAASETLRLEIGELDIEIAKLTEEIETLGTLLAIDPARAASTLRLHTDAEFGGLARAASEEAASFAALSERFGQAHPKVVNARLRYGGARSQMLARAVVLTGHEVDLSANEFDNVGSGERVVLLSRLVSLETDRDSAVAERTAMWTEFARNEARVRDLVDVASELDSMERDYKVAEAVFASALARTSTSKADVFASYPMVQVAEPATVPWSPSSPKLVIAIAAGVAGTLMLVMGLVLAWIRRPIIARLTTFAGDADA